MNIITTLKKSLLGFLTFVTAYLATNPGIITNLVPENIAHLTIGGAISAVIVGITNWLKNKEK